MPAPSRRGSLWALPAASDAPPFVTEITRLAALVDTDAFAPHITIVGAMAGEVDAAIGSFTPFQVTLIGLADSEARFRCITATVAGAQRLLDLRSACGEAPDEYEPHLSLLYAELPPETRAALRASVELPLPMPITIDTVSLVDTSDNDYTRWTTERRWHLG
jgi:2'-5' RNA ligase